ncbi:hypothetical protein PUN28_004426 [Cardiocondyla obscurior]|uniref:Uncharacterized protein n=1 Tax=Cardiocondyla obscurior TaxID=286306 RepID=A0AAW2GCM1_9HYME
MKLREGRRRTDEEWLETGALKVSLLTTVKYYDDDDNDGNDDNDDGQDDEDDDDDNDDHDDVCRNSFAFFSITLPIISKCIAYNHYLNNSTYV